MKVNPLFDAFRAFPDIRRKGDGEGGHGRQQPDSGQDEPREQPDPPEVEAAPEDVRKAIESFGSEASVASAGLRATAEGQGPGLRVILKDGSGAVVRQLTGEEFLRLRDAAGRGRILDRKL